MVAVTVTYKKCKRPSLVNLSMEKPRHFKVKTGGTVFCLWHRIAKYLKGWFKEKRVEDLVFLATCDI